MTKLTVVSPLQRVHSKLQKNKNTLYQVNDDIFAKLSSPFCCNFADMHNSFWIISVYMKNRRIYNLMKKETIEQTTRNKFIQVVI